MRFGLVRFCEMKTANQIVQFRRKMIVRFKLNAAFCDFLFVILLLIGSDMNTQVIMFLLHHTLIFRHNMFEGTPSRKDTAKTNQERNSN
jgi:fatty acid desaturase